MNLSFRPVREMLVAIIRYATFYQSSLKLMERYKRWSCGQTNTPIQTRQPRGFFGVFLKRNYKCRLLHTVSQSHTGCSLFLAVNLKRANSALDESKPVAELSPFILDLSNFMDKSYGTQKKTQYEHGSTE